MIADVCGKGIPAAIFMAVSRTVIRTTGLRGLSPAECIDTANKLIAADSVDCMFVTVFYGILQILSKSNKNFTTKQLSKIAAIHTFLTISPLPV